MILRIYSVVVLSVLCVLVSSQFFPQSPCPDIFRYDSDGGQVHGTIRHQPSGRVATVIMRANFSIKAMLPSNYIGQLEVIGSKQQVLQSVLRGEPLMYRVHFPVTSPLPRLTSITVNGQTVCYGSPEQARPGEAITTISLDHMLYANGKPSGPSNQPFYNGGNYQQNRPNFENEASNQNFQNGNQNFHDGNHNHNHNFHDGNHNFQDGNQNFQDGNQNFQDSNRFQSNPGGFNFNGDSMPSYVINTATVPVGGLQRPQLVTQLFPLSDVNQQQSRPDPPPLQPSRQPPPQVGVVSGPVECGVVGGADDRVPLVYHGSAVMRGDWPWVVAIYVRRESGLQFICAASLVSNQHVVTAAHCMHQRITLTAMRDVVLKVGAFNLDDWSDDTVVTRSLRAADIHFSYSPQTLENDILLLTLDKPVSFTNFIRPVCLWEDSPDLSLIVGQSGTVVGWGGNELGPSGHGEPRMASLPIVSTETCRASRIEFHKLTSGNTLCAGDRRGAGPCNGDSGGGLYILSGGRWRLRGVVSVSLRPVTGEAVCNLNEYLVFTDAAKYLPWLQQHLTSVR